MQRTFCRVMVGALVVGCLTIGQSGSLIAVAQTTGPTNSTAALGDFPADLWGDVLTLPTNENMWWLLGGTTLAVVVYQFENPTSAAETLNQGALDPISDFGNIWGDIRVQTPLALGAWGIASATDNAEIAGLGYDLSRGLALSYGLISVLKISFGRTRPNGDHYSFPSGHTATAFTTAGVVSRRYGGWPGGIAIGLAMPTGMGRMEDMKHYASDVAVGATIGWIVGRNAGRSAPTDGISWQLVPVGQGVALAGRF